MIDSQGSPTISVIIPTQARPDELDAAVRSVLRQSVMPQQLIIVDQSRHPQSQRQVEAQFAQAPAEIKQALELSYIRNSTISSGSAARNRGMEVARGEVWLFLDDDVELEPDFLKELLNVYVRHPQVVGVSGIITNYRRPSLLFRVWAGIFFRGPFRDERQPIYWNAEKLRHGDPIRVSRMGGGLMSFRAKALPAIRFDEDLLGVSDGEDIDFCARLGPEAILMIAPRARLVHKLSPRGRDQAHWLRRDARAKHYLYQRIWRHGVARRLAFLWLSAGYAIAASLGSLRRGSLDPWRAFLAGIRDTRQVFSRKREADEAINAQPAT